MNACLNVAWQVTALACVLAVQGPVTGSQAQSRAPSDGWRFTAGYQLNPQLQWDPRGQDNAPRLPATQEWASAIDLGLGYAVGGNQRLGLGFNAGLTTIPHAGEVGWGGYIEPNLSLALVRSALLLQLHARLSRKDLVGTQKGIAVELQDPWFGEFRIGPTLLVDRLSLHLSTGVDHNLHPLVYAGLSYTFSSGAKRSRRTRRHQLNATPAPRVEYRPAPPSLQHLGPLALTCFHPSQVFLGAYVPVNPADVAYSNLVRLHMQGAVGRYVRDVSVEWSGQYVRVTPRGGNTLFPPGRACALRNWTHSSDVPKAAEDARKRYQAQLLTVGVGLVSAAAITVAWNNHDSCIREAPKGAARDAIQEWANQIIAAGLILVVENAFSDKHIDEIEWQALGDVDFSLPGAQDYLEAYLECVIIGK